MNIEIGSKWVKDGEVVEVVSNFHFTLEDEHEKNDGIDLFSGYTVWFLSRCREVSVLTKRDFLEQYKPYEPVYEWEFVAQQPDGVRHFTHFMTDKEIEFFSFQNDCAYYQRLDFTKRERKQ